MMHQVVNAYLAGSGVSTLARYWRLRFPDGSPHATWLSVADIEMRGTVGGSDLTSTSGASASSAEGGFPASNAFDGSVGNVWFPASGSDVNSWIACDLLTPSDLAEILVYGHPNDANYGPSRMLVEYSNDGFSWTTDARWPNLENLLWDVAEPGSFGQTRIIKRETTPRLINIGYTKGLNQDSIAWNGFTLRQSMAASAFPVDNSTGTANRVRFSLRAGTAEGLTVAKCYIQIKGIGAYSFASTPIQVTFNGGSSSFSIAANALQWSDDITLTVGPTDDVTISMYMNSAAADTFRRQSGSQTGVTSGFKSGDDATTQSPSGYTAQNRQYLGDLEVWDIAS